MEQFSISGLKKIRTLNPDLIPSEVRFMASARLKINLLSPGEQVPIFGKSELKANLTPLEESAELNFNSTKYVKEEDIPFIALAFIAVDNNGLEWLIGAREPPYPKIEIIHSSGEQIAAQSGFSYKISWDFFPIRLY